ncbi:MAG: hypothetical protein ACLU9S_04495 [Oscillospiraceae bacterium]
MEGVNNFEKIRTGCSPETGSGRYESGSITINGGTVKATAKGDGFGIGGARVYNHRGNDRYHQWRRR